MTILLLGFISSGKTSIGKLLAKKIDHRFVELDDMIVHHTGQNDAKTISQIDWKEAELEICKDLSTFQDIVVACASGIVENNLNLLYFQSRNPNTIIIYLDATNEVLATRILSQKPEINLDFEALVARIQALKNQREFLFTMYATHTISTTGKEAPQVVEEIVHFLNQV